MSYFVKTGFVRQVADAGTALPNKNLLRGNKNHTLAKADAILGAADNNFKWMFIWNIKISLLTNMSNDIRCRRCDWRT